MSAALIADILGREDGPHRKEADAWVRRELCESCFRAPAELDDLCLGCTQEANRIWERIRRVMRRD